MPDNTFLIAMLQYNSDYRSNIEWIVDQESPYKTVDPIAVPDDLLEHIYSLYKNEYSRISPKLLLNDKDALFEYNRWILLENDEDNVCAFFLYKTKSYGLKLGITATDQSSFAKKALIKFHIKAFNISGVVGEISPPLEDKIINEVPRMPAAKAAHIIDKKITLHGDGYHYYRDIKNVGRRKKILVGKLTRLSE